MHFNHFNFNVLDLGRSLTFYKEPPGLEPVGRIDVRDGSLHIAYPEDQRTGSRLELTVLTGRKEPCEPDECRYCPAMTAEDFEEAHKRHADMGVICYKNEAMGIYFIRDPDGYWIEIVPERQKAAPSGRIFLPLFFV